MNFNNHEYNESLSRKIEKPKQKQRSENREIYLRIEAKIKNNFLDFRKKCRTK